jgi:serine/threonine protein kinase
VSSDCKTELIVVNEALRNNIDATSQTTLKIAPAELPAPLIKKPECLLLDHKLGSGSFGEVRQVMFAVKHTRSGKLGCIFHGTQEKSKAVKSINQHQMKMKEYTLGSQAPHLGMKPPVFFNQRYYLTMRKLPGLPLDSLLEKMSKNPAQYSWSFKLTLSIKMLKALKAQTLDLDICHNDIKPENIMVHIMDDEIEVNILDYGLSKKLSAIKKSSDKGTPLYFPPEYFIGIKRSAKSDLFSMARVIELVWGENEYEINSHTMRDVEEHVRNLTFNKLFKISGLPDLHQDTQENIKAIFTQMLEWEEKSRLTVEEAIE